MCNSGLLIDAATKPTFGGPLISGFLSVSQKPTIFTASKRDQTSAALKSNPDGSIDNWGLGSGNVKGSLFTQKFAQQMQKLVDKNQIDKNSDKHIDILEYDNAAKYQMLARQNWLGNHQEMPADLQHKILSLSKSREKGNEIW